MPYKRKGSPGLRGVQFELVKWQLAQGYWPVPQLAEFLMLSTTMIYRLGTELKINIIKDNRRSWVEITSARRYWGSRVRHFDPVKLLKEKGLREDEQKAAHAKRPKPDEPSEQHGGS